MHPSDEHPQPPPTSHVRDHLANERTLLSWVRLGLSAAGFGFVVARFGLFLRETSGQSASAHPGRLTEWIGVVLILLGPTLVIIAALRFFQTEREIDENIYRKRHGLIWSVVVASILLGLALAGYLVVTGR
ncbi:MAG: DUF202 domain-containing protein [Chloroflexota bacterium]|nr:DUF202 domain-containing protein [Chloroflexota bacterium]